jgi:hypothetical protein
MADITTIATQGHFGTVTDRIVAIATQGHFLEIEVIVLIPVTFYRLSDEYGFYSAQDRYRFSRTRDKYSFETERDRYRFSRTRDKYSFKKVD